MTSTHSVYPVQLYAVHICIITELLCKCVGKPGERVYPEKISSATIEPYAVVEAEEVSYFLLTYGYGGGALGGGGAT